MMYRRSLAIGPASHLLFKSVVLPGSRNGADLSMSGLTVTTVKFSCHIIHMCTHVEVLLEEIYFKCFIPTAAFTPRRAKRKIESERSGRRRGEKRQLLQIEMLKMRK